MDLRAPSGAGVVVAYGGAGLSSSTPHLTPVERALMPPGSNTCLIPTASGDTDQQMDAFRRACEEAGVEGHVLSLFRRTPAPFANVIDPADLVYATGGAVANLVALWRVHGLAQEVVAAWRQGTALLGSSAGAITWSRGGVTTSFGAPAPFTQTLGLLPFSLCPHADTQPDRRELYEQCVRDGRLPPGYAVDECAAAVFADGVLVDVLSDDGTSGVTAVGDVPPAPAPRAAGDEEKTAN